MIPADKRQQRTPAELVTPANGTGQYQDTGAYQPKVRETDRSIGRSNTAPEADSPVVDVSDRGVTHDPTATKE